jgi:hypothetical protein
MPLSITEGRPLFVASVAGGSGDVAFAVSSLAALLDGGEVAFDAPTSTTSLPPPLLDLAVCRQAGGSATGTLLHIARACADSRVSLERVGCVRLWTRGADGRPRADALDLGDESCPELLPPGLARALGAPAPAALPSVVLQGPLKVFQGRGELAELLPGLLAPRRGWSGGATDGGEEGARHCCRLVTVREFGQAAFCVQPALTLEDDGELDVSAGLGAGEVGVFALQMPASGAGDGDGDGDGEGGGRAGWEVLDATFAGMRGAAAAAAAAASLTLAGGSETRDGDDAAGAAAVASGASPSPTPSPTIPPPWDPSHPYALGYFRTARHGAHFGRAVASCLVRGGHEGGGGVFPVFLPAASVHQFVRGLEGFAEGRVSARLLGEGVRDTAPSSLGAVHVRIKGARKSSSLPSSPASGLDLDLDLVLPLVDSLALALPLPTFRLLLARSAVAVVTGDASLNEALAFGVPFWYSAEGHKAGVARDLRARMSGGGGGAVVGGFVDEVEQGFGKGVGPKGWDEVREAFREWGRGVVVAGGGLGEWMKGVVRPG